MNSAAARVSGSEKEKRKKLMILYHASGEGLRRNTFIVLSHRGYNI
jgi:hypothetical protein